MNRLAQKDMYQQRLEDAVTEAQKPLARHRDDEDLDRMLREQEREGDPMAAMLRRKKEKNTKTKGCCFGSCPSSSPVQLVSVPLCGTCHS